MPIVLKSGSRPPWIGLAAALWVLFAAGNNYCFALYSHSLKSILSLNQQQITSLGVANDIGQSVGILAGISINKFPPWKVLLIGAISCFSGYGVIWLAITQRVGNMPYTLV